MIHFGAKCHILIDSHEKKNEIKIYLMWLIKKNFSDIKTIKCIIIINFSYVDMFVYEIFFFFFSFCIIIFFYFPFSTLKLRISL